MVLFLLFSSDSLAQQPELISTLANKIFQDCSGQTINLKENTIFVEMEPISQIPSNRYTVGTIEEVLRIISAYGVYSSDGVMVVQYDANINGKIIEYNNSGVNILSCGANKLDIYGTNFYWNNKLIEAPSANYGPGSAVTFGPNSPATSGGLAVNNYGNLFEINFLSKETGIGAILGAAAWELWKRFQKRRKPKPKSDESESKR